MTDVRETPVTELETLEVDRIDGVGKGANGFPLLVIKQVDAVTKADGVECPTCEGDGTIRAGNVKCPDCGGDGTVTQDKADELTKAKYSAEQLRNMVKSGEAIENESGDPAFPIGDKDDLAAAIKAVGRAKGDHDDVRAFIIKRAKALGASDEIPDNWNSDGSLTKDVPDDDGIPGSKTWEAADAARLNDATQALLDLQALLTEAASREQIEGTTVDPDDLNQAWTLQDACWMLSNLLGVVAAMAVVEQRESDMADDSAMKAGKRLSDKTIKDLTAARDALTALLGDDDPAATTDDAAKAAEPKDVLTMTPEELNELVATQVAEHLAAKGEDATKADAEVTEPAADEATDTAEKAEDTDVVKEVADAVAKSVDEALRPVIDRLAVVEKMAAPGGPSKTRTPTQLSKSAERDLVVQAERYEQLADATTDHDLRKGYEDKAKQVRAEAAALTA